MKKVRNATVTVPTMKLRTPFVTETAAPDHVVLRLEEAEASFARGQVVDISRSRVDEVVDVVDECRDECVTDTGDRDEDDEACHPGRNAA
jgi:hypothetical protein